MAILRPEVSFKFDGIIELARLFPELNGRFLQYIGKRGRTLLKNNYLSGQEIMLRKFPKDKRGQYTVVSDVNKRRTSVKIYSPTVNLFERGRTLRDGTKEPGKFIITKKLKQAISSRMGSYTREFENNIIEKELKRLGI